MYQIYQLIFLLLLQFNIEMMESMFNLAKYRYECGNYSNATGFLYFYINVMPSNDKVSLPKGLPFLSSYSYSVYFHHLN